MRSHINMNRHHDFITINRAALPGRLSQGKLILEKGPDKEQFKDLKQLDNKELVHRTAWIKDTGAAFWSQA